MALTHQKGQGDPSRYRLTYGGNAITADTPMRAVVTGSTLFHDLAIIVYDAAQRPTMKGIS